MIGKKTPLRDGLDRLVDALVEDILSTPDKDILAELKECGGDPARNAAEMRAFFERSIVAANKHRLAQARAGAARNRKRRVGGPVDIAQARQRLRAILDSAGGPQGLTLAARKESELSDSDIVSMLDDLYELGAFPPKDDEEEGEKEN